MPAANPGRIPVTVLTGFLGAGKTTLLNRILGEHHGRRIAVIENEFGEIGIDQALVINADEEIFEMNNGCICEPHPWGSPCGPRSARPSSLPMNLCCTVRGDLIRILGNLLERRERRDPRAFPCPRKPRFTSLVPPRSTRTPPTPARPGAGAP
jgi:hypothetical protein